MRLHLGAYDYAAQHTLLTVEFMIGLRRLADWWWEAGYFHRLASEQFGRPTWCFEGLAPSRRHAALRPLDLQALGREVRRESRASQAQRARRRRERAEAKGERG